MLAYQTWLMFDAILRTLTRMFITHRHLLEWVTATQAKNAVDLQAVRQCTSAWPAACCLRWWRWWSLLMEATMRGRLCFRSSSFGLPLRRWRGRSVFLRGGPGPNRSPLSNARALRLIARRTWRFFETFITSTDHALPPDNFQEDPRPVVAHRTSPTNMGLYLLSTLAAHDLGYLGTLDAVERVEATLGTMSQMELLRGHFYNWYDTRDIRPLNPKYVSSVDSGNLAGHLLALGNGCRELIWKSPLGARSLAGMVDTLELLREALSQVSETKRTNTVTRKQLSNAIEALANSLELAPVNAAEWAERFVEMRTAAVTIADIAQTFAQERGDPADSELRTWADAVRACVESHVRDAEILIPWMRQDSKTIMSHGRTSAATGTRVGSDRTFL